MRPIPLSLGLPLHNSMPRLHPAPVHPFPQIHPHSHQHLRPGDKAEDDMTRRIGVQSTYAMSDQSDRYTPVSHKGSALPVRTWSLAPTTPSHLPCPSSCKPYLQP